VEDRGGKDRNWGPTRVSGTLAGPAAEPRGSGLHVPQSDTPGQPPAALGDLCVPKAAGGQPWPVIRLRGAEPELGSVWEPQPT